MYYLKGEFIMSEKVMNNMKEKLSKCRELCVGMSERAYLLADYMSEIVPDTVTPYELTKCLIEALEDIDQERCRKRTKKEELLYYLNLDKTRIRYQAVNIPRMIDEIADVEFAEEFRSICDEAFAEKFRSTCKEKFGFDPIKHDNAKLQDYPDYVQVAVKWWADAISSPKLDTKGSSVSSFFAEFIKKEVGVKAYSSKELLDFKITLADEIMEDIIAWEVCTLSVDYQPCDALVAAGKKIGTDQYFGYPLKTSMTIFQYEVKVYVGVVGECKTLWTNTN